MPDDPLLLFFQAWGNQSFLNFRLSLSDIYWCIQLDFTQIQPRGHILSVINSE